MFFILLGLIVCITIFICACRNGTYEWKLVVLLPMLLLCFTALGTVSDWGHEEFVKKEEIPIYQYSNSDKYLKVSKYYYYFIINKSEEYSVEYDSLEEYYVLRKEAKVYEQENIDNPVIVKYTAKPKKNFFTFGLRDDDEMYKIYIPKGTIGMK